MQAGQRNKHGRTTLAIEGGVRQRRRIQSKELRVLEKRRCEETGEGSVVGMEGGGMDRFDGGNGMEVCLKKESGDG